MDPVKLVAALRRASIRANPYVVDVQGDCALTNASDFGMISPPDPEAVAAGRAASKVLSGIADAIEEAFK